MDKRQTSTFSFENNISELQGIVDKLESDAGVSLEESMELYKQGLELTKKCVDDLNSVQTEINDLNKQLDAILSRPLFGDDNE